MSLPSDAAPAQRNEPSRWCRAGWSRANRTPRLDTCARVQICHLPAAMVSTSSSYIPTSQALHTQLNPLHILRSRSNYLNLDHAAHFRNLFLAPHLANRSPTQAGDTKEGRAQENMVSF
ncbi:unnamed protein product [Diplocarpon coronariae]|nr:hypothetical protein JHW43_003377 [Diplocarpon mali]